MRETDDAHVINQQFGISSVLQVRTRLVMWYISQ